MSKCTCFTETPCILTCEWCGEEFKHGHPGVHNDRSHIELHLRIREVKALEEIGHGVTVLSNWTNTLGPFWVRGS